MHCIEDPLVFPTVFALDDVFMPDNATVHPVALEIETVYPCVWIDNQPFVSPIIKMIPEEASQGMFRQLVLTIPVE